MSQNPATAMVAVDTGQDSELVDEEVPVGLWTPAGLQGPMAFDLSSEEGLKGLRAEVEIAMEGYDYFAGQGGAVDHNLGEVRIVSMPRTQLDSLPEHPGW